MAAKDVIMLYNYHFKIKLFHHLLKNILSVVSLSSVSRNFRICSFCRVVLLLREFLLKASCDIYTHINKHTHTCIWLCLLCVAHGPCKLIQEGSLRAGVMD